MAALDITDRTEAGAALTQAQHDANMQAIEDAVNAKPDATGTIEANDYARFTTASDGVEQLVGRSTAEVLSDLGALTKAELLSGTLTARADDIDLSGGSDGDALMVQADGSLALETPAATSVAEGSITNAMIRDSAALSVIGRSANSSGDVDDISASAASGAVLRESGSTIGFGTIATAGLADEAVTNAKLAHMAQSTIKGRAEGAGTGDATDLSVAQVKAILDVAFSDLTGQATLAQFPNIASPTVIANVSGSTGVPSAVSPETFKTEFGFGGLADEDNITVEDISATGTPSASTFLAGDGSWKTAIPSVSYSVEDIDDATTLDASHSRYQTSGSDLVILQLRLRNSSDQADPVRVTIPDSDSITPAGAEFDFIVADDQTGPCVIRAQTNGSINGHSFATTAVADLVVTGSSGANTTFTSAGANLPDLDAGDVFELTDHSTAANNGLYIATGSPSTSSLSATKLEGSNPSDAASEAANILSVYIALAGARSTAVSIVDANAGTAPNMRLEGETREPRTIVGATTFSDSVDFDGAVDFDGTADFDGAVTFSSTITFDGSAAVTGGGKVITNVELTDTAEGFVDAGNKNGAATFDYTAGAWQKCVATGNITSVTISNPPATGRVGTITLEIHQDGTGGKTIAWGAAFRFPGGTDFTLSSGASDIDIFTLSTRDGGTTWYAFEGGKDFAA